MASLRKLKLSPLWKWACAQLGYLGTQSQKFTCSMIIFTLSTNERRCSILSRWLRPRCKIFSHWLRAGRCNILSHWLKPKSHDIRQFTEKLYTLIHRCQNLPLLPWFFSQKHKKNIFPFHIISWCWHIIDNWNSLPRMSRISTLDKHQGRTPFYFMYDPKFPWCTINSTAAFAWCTINAPAAFAWCTINAPAAFAWCTINVPAAFSWCMNHSLHEVEISYTGWNRVHPLWQSQLSHGCWCHGDTRSQARASVCMVLT